MRRFADWIYSAYAWLLVALLLPVFGLLIMLAHKPKRARPLARIGARLLFRLAGMPLRATGLERLPATSHILLVNHTSFLDGIALIAMLPARPGYAFVVRQQFAVQRLLCPLLRALGTVVLMPAGAGSHAGNAALMASALRHRGNLVVFPEAGFLPQPGLRRFHSGAFVAAAANGAPLVVTGLRGARQALRPRAWLLRRMPLTLEVGTVLQTSPSDIAMTMRSARANMLRLAAEPDALDERQRQSA